MLKNSLLTCLKSVNFLGFSSRVNVSSIFKKIYSFILCFADGRVADSNLVLFCRIRTILTGSDLSIMYCKLNLLWMRSKKDQIRLNTVFFSKIVETFSKTKKLWKMSVKNSFPSSPQVFPRSCDKIRRGCHQM